MYKIFYHLIFKITKIKNSSINLIYKEKIDINKIELMISFDNFVF